MYREKVEKMSDDEFEQEVMTSSFLAARVRNFSKYDQQCDVLMHHNRPLYDAVRMRLERSLRAL
jgi:hypothetical protein